MSAPFDEDRQCQWCAGENPPVPLRHDGELFCSDTCVKEYREQFGTPAPVLDFTARRSSPRG